MGSQPRHPAGTLRRSTGRLLPGRRGTRGPSCACRAPAQNPLLSAFSFETWAQPSASAAHELRRTRPHRLQPARLQPDDRGQALDQRRRRPRGPARRRPPAPESKRRPRRSGRGRPARRDGHPAPGPGVNPSSANGLGACSLAQIGYQGIKEGKPSFSTEPANCPDASKIGTVEIDTPLLDHPIPGSIYLAKQAENPFGTLIALYIAVDDPITGVVIKLAGKVEPDPVTGQLTNVFEQNPQLPFEDLKVDLFNGARAPLRTPQTCGDRPPLRASRPRPRWSPGPRPKEPPPPHRLLRDRPGPRRRPLRRHRGPAAERPELRSRHRQTPWPAPTPPSSSSSPAQDGSQELQGLNVTLPPGLIAKLAGTSECSAAGVAQAQARDQPRPGRPRAGLALLPGLQPARHRHRRRRRRPHPLLRPGQRLPRRPLQRRPAQPG